MAIGDPFREGSRVRKTWRLTFPCAGCNDEVGLDERAEKKEAEGTGGWVRKLTRAAP